MTPFVCSLYDSRSNLRRSHFPFTMFIVNRPDRKALLSFQTPHRILPIHRLGKRRYYRLFFLSFPATQHHHTRNTFHNAIKQYLRPVVHATNFHNRYESREIDALSSESVAAEMCSHVERDEHCRGCGRFFAIILGRFNWWQTIRDQDHCTVSRAAGSDVCLT